jgi:hypothetical protein
VTACPTDLHPGVSYTLSGTQLNGLSQAVSYGDDAQMATNYPLVRLRNAATGSVIYCRTFDHSTMGVATGAATVSTTFTVPASVPQASYFLSVVANGIASAEVAVTVDPGSGRAQYALVDRYSTGNATLWAYIDEEWLARPIGAAELAGVAQDVFAASQVDAWWDNFELSITRGWKSY